MAQRPTFPSPYLNAIDATKDNEFICLINDRDVITDYIFTIQQYIKTTNENNTTTTTFKEVYKYPDESSGIKVEPIYGGRGNDSYLIVTVDADTLSNGEEYKWQVKLTDSLGSTVESKEYYFTCIAEPTLNITSSDIKEGILNTANATFTGTYSCDSPLVYYRFILSKDGNVVKDTGEVYSQYLCFEYDMFTQGDYSLVLQIENEKKMKTETSIDFTVNYTTALTNVVPECYVSPDENSVIVDFSSTMTIPGTYVPSTEKYQQIDISDTLKGGYIPKDTELYWEKRVGVSDSLEIDEESFNVQLMVNLPYGKQGEIIRLSGDNEILVTFDGFNIHWRYNNGNSGSLSIGDEIFAKIGENDSINKEAVYTFYFNEETEYDFSANTHYVFQNPMNVYWWLLTITPTGVTIEKGAEVVV